MGHVFEQDCEKRHMTLIHDDGATQLVDDDIGTDASFKETVESIEPDPDDFDDIFGTPKRKMKPAKAAKPTKVTKQSKLNDEQTFATQADESESQPRHSHKRKSAAVALPSNLGKLIGSGLLITIVAVVSMFAIMYGVSLARAHGALSQAQEQVVDAKASLVKSLDTLETATTKYSTALDASGVDVASYRQAKTQANDDVAAAQQALANLDDAIQASSEYTWHSANGWSVKKLNETASGWRKLASTGESMSQSAHDTANDLSRVREDLELRIKANVVQPVKQNNNDNDNNNKQSDNDTDQSTGASAGSTTGSTGDMNNMMNSQYVQNAQSTNANQNNGSNQQPQQSQQQRQVQSQTQAPPDVTEVIVEQKSDGGFVLSQENKDGAAWLNKLKAGDTVILNGKEYVLSGDVLHGSTLAEANASAR